MNFQKRLIDFYNRRGIPCFSMIEKENNVYVEEVNDAFLKIFGRTLDINPGMEIKGLFPVEDYYEFYKALNESKKNKEYTFTHSYTGENQNLRLLFNIIYMEEESSTDYHKFLCTIFNIPHEGKKGNLFKEYGDEWDSFLNTLPGIIIILDSKYKIIRCNRRFIEKINLNTEEIIGKDIRNFFSPDTSEKFLEKVSSMKEFSLIKFKGDFLTKFNKQLNVWIRALPFFGENKNLYRVVLFCEEMKENDIAREIIETSEFTEVKYKTLFENAGDAIFLMKDDRFIECNEKTLEMFGCRKEDIIGETPYRFSPDFQPDGRPSREAALERIEKALSGVPQHFYWKHTKLDGTPFDAEVSLNSIRIGEEVLLQAIVRDITEKKTIQDNLRKSYELIKAILDNSPIGISVRDRTGTLLIYNEAWKKIWNISDKEIERDLTKREHLKFDERDDYLSEYHDKVKEIYTRGGTLFLSELKIKNPRPGGARWISQYFYSIRGEDGNVEKVVILTQDITSKKMKELQQEVKIKLLNNIRGVESIEECLKLGCEAVKEAQLFKTCIMKLYYENPEEGMQLLERVKKKGLKISNSYFIPSENKSSSFNAYEKKMDVFNYINGLWQDGDQLVVPVYDKEGKLEASILVDEPLDGKRPGRDKILYLEEIADIVVRYVRELRNLIQIKESENKYRQLLHNSVIGIFVLQNFVIKFCNKKLLQMLGYDREEVIGKSIKNFLPSQEWEKLKKENLIELFKKGEARDYTTQLIRKDGTVIDVEVRGGRILYEGSYAFQGTLVDITQKKKMEKMLKTLNNMYKMVANALVSSNDVRDMLNKILQWVSDVIDFGSADIALRIEDDLIMVTKTKSINEDFYKDLFNLQKEKGREFILGKKTLELGKPIFVENPVENPLTSYAREVIMQYNISNIYSVPILSKGKPIGVLQITFDGNKRMKSTEKEIIDIVSKEISAGIDKIISEEMLKHRERLYSMLLENINEGIYLLRDKHYEYVNPKFCEITGYTFKELTDEDFDYSILIPEEFRDFMEERYKTMMEGKEISSNYEIKLRRKDGKLIDVAVNTVRIEYRGGTFILGIIRDITQELRIKEELAKLEKLETIGVLAGGIAHDFNNILMGIVGNISLAKMHCKYGDEIYKILDDAEKASLSAKNLTKQLLTFSKGGTPVKEVIDLKELLKSSVEFTLRGTKTKAEFEIQEDLYPVEVDEGQISQVINNIVLNAVQAMPEGGIIRVRAKNVHISSDTSLSLKEGDYVLIEIEDQGVGIPPEHLPKIFDPFFTTKHKGSGLGLAISFSIIKKHKGEISVDSTPGKGSTFYIYLPASSKKTFTKKMEQHIEKGKGKILIMDDQDMVIKVASEMLEYLGYDVFYAKNGADAVKLYREEKEKGVPFDAVILDLTVPGGMGGKEAAQNIIKFDPDARLIVSSGYSTAPIMSNYRDYGFSDVITKPYTISKLSQVLKRVLEKKK